MKRIVCLVLALLCVVPLVAYGMVSDAAGTAPEAAKTQAELEAWAATSDAFKGIAAKERAEIIEIVEAWYSEYLDMTQSEDFNKYTTDYEYNKNSGEYTKAYYAETQYHNFSYSSNRLRPTRTVESLKNWEESEYYEKEYELDVYGGWVNHPFGELEVTGYFYVQKLGGRWYYIDPLGNPCIIIGVVGPLPHYDVNTVNKQQQAAALEKYGTEEKWWVYTVNHLKHEDGFNLATAHPSEEFLNVPEGLNTQKSIKVMTAYATETGALSSTSGNTEFNGNAIPVFDPGFPAYAESYIRDAVAPYLNDERVVGFTTDNEFPMHDRMLAYYLTLDINAYPYHRYSYAAACAWSYKMTGIDPAIYKGLVYDDVKKETDAYKTTLYDDLEPYFDLFRGFVYYRYFSVIAPIMKEVAPNHMYGGHRFYTPEQIATVLTAEWVIRFAGKYCDYICINWYRREWTLTTETARNWTMWSGDKPFLITEFYAKSNLSIEAGDTRDVTLEKKSGVMSGGGWYVDGYGQLNGVNTQVGNAHQARADYYENSTLAFLEWGNIIGWHWYRYNHYWLSNGNTLRSAGGIVNDAHVPYPEFEEAFEQVNKHVYGLAEFFDDRR